SGGEVGCGKGGTGPGGEGDGPGREAGKAGVLWHPERPAVRAAKDAGVLSPGVERRGILGIDRQGGHVVVASDVLEALVGLTPARATVGGLEDAACIDRPDVDAGRR